MEDQEEIIREEEAAEAPAEAAEETQPAEEERRQAEDFSRFEEHIRNLEDQGRQLQQSFPDFDLGRELRNPVFLQLTAPGTGIGVEDAYYALHRKEIQQAQARETTQKVVSAIQAGSRRPLEAGTSGQAPSLTTFQYGNASREQREAFKRDLRRAWGRGETVYPTR